AVVAQLGRDDHAVATACDAVTRAAGRRARVSRLHGQAVGGAAVARDGVAVVARLVGRPLAVAAYRGHHDRSAIRPHAGAARAARGSTRARLTAGAAGADLADACAGAEQPRTESKGQPGSRD